MRQAPQTISMACRGQTRSFELSDTRNRARLILEDHIHIHYIVPDNFVGQYFPKTWISSLNLSEMLTHLVL